jgi:hypothetical protein
LCLDKIFAEFFHDLINMQITEKVINKHTPVIIEIMNAASINLETANTDENNNKLYKLLKDWIKEKIGTKLNKINTLLDNTDPKIMTLIERENSMIQYLKEHKNELLKKFVEYKNNAVKLN